MQQLESSTVVCALRMVLYGSIGSLDTEKLGDGKMEN